MAGQCQNCGAELFAGQQFCRRCGTPTGLRHAGEQPTQLFDSGRPTGDQSAHATAAVRGAGTGGFTPTPPPARQYAPPFSPAPSSPPARPRRRARRWILAFLIIGAVGLASLAAALFGLSARRNVVRERVLKQVKINHPEAPARPGAPGAGGVVVRDEGGDADAADSITRTFQLGEGASVSLKNLSGKITVEGWDEARAEVKVTKSGGTSEERRAVRIVSQASPDKLSLQTELPKGVESGVEVEYEVKLPRGVRQLEVSSMNSDVELSGLSGAVSVNLFNGRIELSDVGGPVNTKSVNGDVRVELGEAALRAKGPSSFNLVKGDLELKLPEGLNADVSADVVTGGIEVDEELGIKVERRTIGHHAAGRVGEGGPALSVKAVTGTIRIRS